MARLREVSKKMDLVALRDKMTQYLPHSAGFVASARRVKVVLSGHRARVIATPRSAFTQGHHSVCPLSMCCESYVRGFLDVLILVQQKLDNKVYVPEGSRASSLIVVTPSCSQEHIQNLTLFWDTKEEDDEEVVRLLKTLPGWDWSAPVYFRVHPVAIYTKIQELKKNGRLGNEQMWSHKVFDGSLYSLDTSKLQQIKYFSRHKFQRIFTSTPSVLMTDQLSHLTGNITGQKPKRAWSPSYPTNPLWPSERESWRKMGCQVLPLEVVSSPGVCYTDTGSWVTPSPSPSTAVED
ncbi:uncharacterized protein LOC119578003 isoform X2 [Penaeus monodon]|uniref:uncharacterized protein LOC119578003 isoform X2 n=1 Tax=Penaeus monodon TaxID=6687 RepID=UPI0018A6D7A1|nr:uncharacterized protein LOC119578003 isoform X2 [Penaeus monodon]